ncbi:DUF3081 domain-containing protein [Shewanella holmiensis]|uniref:DUF3081 domain-containing protein n=1 Tax=Shewanella holmiensis TaxID=2952222 RepID=A0A9X2WJQ9_9GAMM|nr:DUF3081 domain-containing protein [Shewanella holmiensis]MCT7940672.1 DUF3081 domain-containing protein [Shewanella holmiensis]
MKNEIDIHRALRVFNKVATLGEKQSDNIQSVYRLCGLNALTDFDGYTISLSDAQVRLDIFFHKKYKFDYPNNEALENFLARFTDVEKYSQN